MNKNQCFICISMLLLIPEIWMCTNDKLRKSQADTVLIKQCIELGDQSKKFKLDSGLYYYNRALSIIEKNNGKNNQLNYFFALTHLKLASLYTDLHQTEKALIQDSIALHAATKINSKEIIAQLLNNKGLIYSFKNKYDTAVLFYGKALKLAKEIRDLKLEAKIYTNIGIIKAYQGDTDSAFVYFKKPLAIGEKINDKEILAGAHNNLGRMYFRIGKLEDALTQHTKAKKLFEEIKDSPDVILCENNIANIFFMKADYLRALERYSSLVEKCSKANDQLTLAKVYHNMGVAYYNIFAFSEATDYYLKSIEIKQKLNDEQGVSSDFISLGSVQISNENPQKALVYYKKALTILTKIGYKSGLARAYNDLGNAYTELNKPDSVIFNLHKAEDLAVTINETSMLATSYYNFAKFYMKISDYGNALNYFNKTIRIDEQLGDVETIGIANYNIAQIYNSLALKTESTSKKQDFYQKALTPAQKAYKIGIDNNFLEVKSEAAKQLKNVYYGFGDRKRALYYYDIYSTATDSLYKKTQSDAAIYAEARWQAEKKQQQIKFLEQEKALKDDLLKAKESENDKQRNIIYLLIGGLIVLVSSASVITYYVRKQRKMEFQQQHNKISMLRLENARSRVSPHFLFNSLTTIQDELSDKPDASKRLHAIVNMLRCSLLNIEKPSIPLKDEMEFVNNYVLLQKSKFIHDLQTEINIENNDLFDYKIPAMIVQIPVENAIKHGLAGKQNGEKILKVDAKRENGTLMISIADNGIGREIARSNFKTGTGTGLKVISQTLHLLNSKNENKIKFSLTDLKNESGENCGTKVDISVPVAFNFEL